MMDLSSRLQNPVQISCDSLSAYVDAVEDAFGSDVDYGQNVKAYKYGPRWVLHPLNPKYEDQEVPKGAFKIIGKVVKKEKRY